MGEVWGVDFSTFEKFFEHTRRAMPSKSVPPKGSQDSKKTSMKKATKGEGKKEKEVKKKASGTAEVAAEEKKAKATMKSKKAEKKEVKVEKEEGKLKGSGRKKAEVVKKVDVQEEEFVVTENTLPEEIFEKTKKYIPPLRKPIGSVVQRAVTVEEKPMSPSKWAAFLKKQKERLLDLKDQLLDSMDGVAKDALRKRAEDSEANAFGMHQADAGSDAYDRDYALNILSREQNSLYEIEEALKRIEDGTYGICQISGKRIPIARLEALPFARFTVECQAELERHNLSPTNYMAVPFYGLTEEEGDKEEEESSGEGRE